MTAPAVVCRPARQVALDLYDRMLARAAGGDGAVLVLRDPAGHEHHVDAARWCGADLPGDVGLLARCTGATLDVGCGPGRLTGALLGAGRAALGIDVSSAAVSLARARGALALRRDVFSAVPGEGRWEHLLLADGNIGIGGDPARLLRRCRALIAEHGRIHVETEPPGAGTWSGPATLHDQARPDGAGAPLRWAQVAAGDLAGPARLAGLAVLTTWTEAGRWFATLAAG
ncbi:class I SAM-dependent methyltransferase [Actinoplanes missouriensis]|uniref:class I SAM-dependent methyltransferase n=1 Tax=Actinoplanes missouriensis TaxID=1866 RepID=UPI0033FFFF37